MSYTIQHIAEILGGQANVSSDATIEYLLIDSRKIHSPASSLFFAIKGPRRDGHQFIQELYKKGIRNFVISDKIKVSDFPEANFILVKDTLAALQELAAHHRRQFQIPVIGITGSNGKTIVKEWLYQLLHSTFNIVRSPKSYNSQIGVPLSVWPMHAQHELAIFEAGISQPREMEKLAGIIQPTIGVLTNIGEAHSEGFRDQKHKISEKLKLFKNADILVAPAGDKLLDEMISASGIKCFCWGKNKRSDVEIVSVKKENSQTQITINYERQTINLNIPFTDDASIENAITCCCVMLVLKIDPAVIRERMKELQPVNMRLELKKGINHCTLINDSYSADLSSLNIALSFLDQQSTGSKRTVILSDFFQTGLSEEKLYKEIGLLLKAHKINKVIGIGKNISNFLKPGGAEGYQFYDSTEDFLKYFRSYWFREETILIKGARVFQFERIVHAMEQKVHQTVLEINLNAIVHNLKEHQKYLHPTTKVMAMVKAFAYGSGGAEIAGILQYHKVDWLGVAYADEGVELRKAGISLPVMVMNPEESTFDAIVENNLEPDLYSLELLKQFDAYLLQTGLQQYPVHIEIETGMNRLGFDPEQIPLLVSFLKQTDSIKIQSLFTHLAASEDPSQDEFTLNQHKKFLKASDELEKELGYTLIKHIANSAAIIRHPQLQMDMVRLGIGMYGINLAGTTLPELQPVASLKSTVAQLKNLKAGESVSYNRKGIVKRNSVIATIRIGYADGYPRRLGNNKGKIFINGRLAPVIGTVCMDMTMVDITDIPGVKEGDEVIIFGKEISIEQLSEWAETIPYEIMTGISQRVKRVYFEE